MVQVLFDHSVLNQHSHLRMLNNSGLFTFQLTSYPPSGRTFVELTKNENFSSEFRSQFISAEMNYLALVDGMFVEIDDPHRYLERNNDSILDIFRKKMILVLFRV